MYMHGNQAGTTPLTDQQALDFLGPVPPGIPGVNTFMMTPTNMTMEMHMLCIMRGITDDVTMYLMPMWMDDTMDMFRRDGTTIRSSNSGLGDLPFGALWRIYQGCADELILNLGVSAPAGDINNQTSMPMGMGMGMGMGMPMSMPFPYSMRLGHGTWDACPGITYRRYWDHASIGVQGTCDLPLGMNDADYRVGNEYRRTAWLAYLLDAKKSIAATFRVEGLWQGNCVGAGSPVESLHDEWSQSKHAGWRLPQFWLWLDVQAAKQSWSA